MRREPIRSSDPKAVPKLQEWLEELEAERRAMVSANKIVRSDRRDKKQALVERGFGPKRAAEILEAGGFPRRQMNLNDSRRQQVKDRIEAIRTARARGPKEYDVIQGVRYFEDPAKMRLGFRFSQAAIPKEISRYMVKRGFWWSMERGAFERHLTDSSRTAAVNARLFFRRWQDPDSECADSQDQ